MKYIFRTVIALLILLFSVTAWACSTGEFQWPVSGPTGHDAGDVGPREPPVAGASEFHRGLDIAVPVGTPVYAAGGGVVERTFFDNAGGGRVMVIRHPNGTKTRYLHLDSFVAQEGQSVSQGQQVAVSGNTGIGAAHLHFEIADASGNRTPMVNGRYWDKAAGLTGGAQINAGDCITGIAVAGLTPGGQVSGDPTNPANPNQPSDDPNNPGNGNSGTTNGNTGGTGSDSPPPLPASPFDPTNVDLDTMLPSPQKWIDATTSIMAEFGLAKHLNTLGFVLLFAGFVYGLANATYFYRSDQYFSLLGRLIIAAGLIWGSPLIAKSGLNMWTSIHNNLQASVTTPAVTELEGHINTFAPLIRDWAVTSGSLNLLASTLPKPFGVDLITPIADMSKDFTRSLFTITVLMGSIYGIFFLMIYVSMLMMLMAGTLLPVLAAFLVLPGMTSWFSRWFSMVVLSLTIIVILPFMLHVVVTVGVSEPVQTLSTIAEGAGEQLNWLLEKAQDENPGFTPWINEYVDYIATMATASLQVLGNIMQIFIRWMFGLIILAVGVLASIYLLQQLPSLLSGLIGSTAGSAASAVTGGAIAGLAIGGAAALTAGGAAQAAGGALAGAVAKTAALPPAALMRPSTQSNGPRENSNKSKETSENQEKKS